MSNIVRDNNIIDFSKIGYNLVSFQSWTLEKAFKVIADVGYSTVELCLEHPEMDPEKLLNGDIARIKAALEENGLRTSAISCNCKDANLDATFSECVKALDVALELGTKIFTISAPPENLDPGGQLTRQTLSKLLQIADNKGIIIAIENEPDSVIHGFYDFSMLISELINLPLGLNLNLSHAALTEQDVAAVINEFASHIVHTSISDCRKNQHDHLIPGDGNLDIHGLIVSLNRNHYQGDYILSPTSVNQSPDQLAKAAMDWCRETLG